MATNGVCTPPDVILVGQNLENRQDIFQLKQPTNIILHTGNIANWNSLRSRKTQLPVNELHQSLKSTLENWLQHKDAELQNECEKSQPYSFETFESPQERPLLKITVKIMLQKSNPSSIEKALKFILGTLKVEYIDSVILAIPALPEEDETPFETTIEPYWRELERLHGTGVAANISSCDLDQKRLEKLVDLAEVKPEVNQVNLTSCCHMPEDLVAYSKAIDVVLHTHGDDPDMLPDERVKEIMHSIEPSSQLNWESDWIVRYTVVVKCRGVIKCKGYVASIACT